MRVFTPGKWYEIRTKDAYYGKAQCIMARNGSIGVSYYGRKRERVESDEGEAKFEEIAKTRSDIIEQRDIVSVREYRN